MKRPVLPVPTLAVAHPRGGRRRCLALGLALCLSAVTGLQGCGFALRSSQNFAFETVAVTPEKAGGVAAELARYLGARVRPLVPGTGGLAPEAVIDILQEAREKTVVGVNASGQVREFQLRLRVRFRLRTPAGAELIAPTEVLLQRDISFNETAVLAKEAEEGLLYRDMQTDAVQQLVRRLAAVKTLAP
ncbi:MAG: LPS assembly lipoprotein LptE [Rhodoferax sp.]|nr:LPS assembly lipoprotein LptE [Rhodoferax sp.]